MTNTDINIISFKDKQNKVRYFSNPGLKPFKFSEEGETRKLQIPILVRGSYKHSEYKEVDFSQESIETIIKNFNQKITGFEPPVFLGHPITTDSVEGHPAIAFIYNVFQDEDYLWAEAEPVDDEAYEAIKSGKYRYASAEVVRDYNSKFEDKTVGPTLVGLAITNRPFIPNMPRIKVFTDSNCAETESFKQFNLLNSITIKDTTTFSNMTEMTSNPIDNETTGASDLADKFLTLTKQIEEARVKAESAEAKLREIEKQNTLSTVESFNLSQTVKDEFKRVFSDGSFSDAQTKTVLVALQKLSDENNTLLLTQRGKQESEPETLKEINTLSIFADNPYKDIIEANKKLAEAKRYK
jgi:hypothetical protein